MNWIMLERARQPDAAYWRGRRCLAAIDAVAWPVAVGLLLAEVPGRSGLFVPIAMVLLALLAGRRLHRAVWRNHRYRFTTWTVGTLVLGLLLVGILLKFALA